MFRIGEFSKIAQVSGRLLRYYDEIGLLCPDFTDPETGYRFYSAHQLPRLNRILVLKELGLPLEQVARLLDQQTSNDELRGILTLRKAQIERTVQEELMRFRDIESRLQQLDSLPVPDVVLKSVPAQGYLAVREILPNMGVVRRLVQNIVATLPGIVGQNVLDTIVIVTYGPMYDPEALDVEVGYLLTGRVPHSVTMSEGRMLTMSTLPAQATMATIAHAGRIEDSHGSYGALGRWLEANQYQFVGPGREILLHVPQPGHEDEAVIEIQFPVTKQDHLKLFI